MNLSLKETAHFKLKLGIGFAGILIIAFASFAISMVSIMKASRERDRRVHLATLQESRVITLAGILDTMVADFRGYLLTGNLPFLTEYRQNDIAFNSGLTLLEFESSDSEAQTLIESIRSTTYALTRPVNSLIREKSAGRATEPIIRKFEISVLPSRLEQHATLDRLVEHTRARLEQERQKTERAMQKEMYEISALMVLALLISIGISWFVARKMGNLFQNVRASERRFRQAIEVSGEAMLERDVKSGQIFWNEGLSKNFGYPESERVTTFEWWKSKIHPDHRNRVVGALERAIANGANFFAAEYKFARGDGTYADVMARVFLIRDKKGTLVRTLGSFVDITHLKRAIESRDEMVAVISHELKNPLTAVGTSIDLMTRLLARGNAGYDVAKSLGRMKSSVQNMNRLISDLLDITRIEARRLSVEIAPFSFPELLQEVHLMYKDLAQKKGVELLSEIDPKISTVECDRYRMIQILSNLIGNAIKFTQAGGMIRIVATLAGDRVQVQIIDTGVGIENENLDKVFDRFWQAKELRFRGTGLGLAIAKGLVEAHQGSLQVKSTKGAGSVFIVEIPIHSVEKRESSREARRTA